jgi:hypothetical protein
MLDDFRLNYFEWVPPIFKNIHNVQKFFVTNIMTNLNMKKLMRMKGDKIKFIFFKLWKHNV